MSETCRRLGASHKLAQSAQNSVSCALIANAMAKLDIALFKEAATKTGKPAITGGLKRPLFQIGFCRRIMGFNALARGMGIAVQQGLRNIGVFGQ